MRWLIIILFLAGCNVGGLFEESKPVRKHRKTIKGQSFDPNTFYDILLRLREHVNKQQQIDHHRRRFVEIDEEYIKKLQKNNK